MMVNCYVNCKLFILFFMMCLLFGFRIDICYLLRVFFFSKVMKINRVLCYMLFFILLYGCWYIYYYIILKGYFME